jgi:hypothetical protein
VRRMMNGDGRTACYLCGCDFLVVLDEIDAVDAYE